MNDLYDLIDRYNGWGVFAKKVAAEHVSILNKTPKWMEDEIVMEQQISWLRQRGYSVMP